MLQIIRERIAEDRLMLEPMNKILMAFAFICLVQVAFGQEQCDNGIDDDNDGLIDLQDDECNCDGTEVFFPTSLFPNPSFEDMICETGASRVDCAEGWMQASAGTPDYIESCQKFSDVIPVPPCDIPSGDKCFGFIYSNITNLQVREYVGTCLTEPLQMGTNYKLNIWVGFLDNNGGDDLFVSHPMDLVVYGNDSCSSMPIEGTRDLCPIQAPNGEPWFEIGRIPVSGNGEWKQYSLDFTADGNYNAVILGPPCEIQSDTANYYFLDNIVLAEVDAFSDDIITIKSQDFETGAMVLEVPEYPDVDYQWYKDDIAVVGETSTEIEIFPCTGDNGSYSVIVSNATGCTMSVPFEVAYEVPTVEISGPSGLCPGDFDQLSISESFTQITWSSMHTDVTQIPINDGGNYSVEVKNDVGCTATDDFDVMSYTEIQFSVDITNETVPNAQDGELRINPLEPLSNVTYSWDNTEMTSRIMNLNEGLYCVTITADNRCDTVACYRVGLDEIPFTFNIDKDNVSCNGGSDGRISIMNLMDGTPPFEFQWSANAGGGTNPVVNNLEAGIYSVTIEDDADVQRIAEVRIEEPEPLRIVATKTDVTCFAGSDGAIEILEITGGNGMNNIVWSPSGSGMLNDGLTAGMYTVEITDQLNCRLEESWDIEQPEPISFQTDVRNVSCFEGNDGEITVRNMQGGNGLFTVSWSNMEVGDKITDLVSGNYQFTITDRLNCLENGTETVNQPQPIVYNYTVIDEHCQGAQDGALMIDDINGGTGSYVVTINGVPLGVDWIRDDLTGNQEYDLAVRDENNCVVGEPFFVGRQFVSEVKLPADTTVIESSLVRIIPSSSEVIDVYNWTSSDEDVVFCDDCPVFELEVNTSMVVQLQTINEFGCVSGDAINITVRPPYGVYWPNAFSPNDDGVNDFFRPFNASVVHVVKKFEVYNRWGGKVFERENLKADDPALWWDGRVLNSRAQIDQYTYFAEIQFIDGTEQTYVGQILVADQ